MIQCSGPHLWLSGVVARRVCATLAAIHSFGAALLAREAPPPHDSMSVSMQQSGESQQEVTTLEPGKLFEREIAGGQKHSYQIALSEGQYIQGEIKWQDTDLGVSLQLPDGNINSLLDPMGIYWNLTIEQVAESTGIYRITVYTRKRAPKGHYTIRIAEQHPATENEQALQQAQRSMQEGNQLIRDGQIDEGRRLMMRALEIREKASGPDSLLVASTLHMVGAYYEDVAGDYASAESAYLRGLKIKEHVLGSEHTDVAVEIEGLGGLYQEMGDDLRAEQMYQKSLGIFEKAGRTENLIVAFMLGQLGDICHGRGDYQCAESFYQRSRALEEKLLGPDSFHLSFSLARLGRAAYDAGNYSEAEEMFQRVLTLSEKTLGRDHVKITESLNDLAMLYCTTGDYAKARAFYERALATHEQQKVMSDPAVQTTLFGLARLYAAQGMATEAVAFQKKAIELEERYVDLNLAVGSEREKLAFLATLSAHSFRNISLQANLAPNDAVLRDLAVTTILQRKGRVQDAMSGSLSALRQRSNAEDQRLLDQFDALTSKLARLVLNGPMNVAMAEYQAQIKMLEEQREELEAEISRRSAGFYQRSQPVALAAVEAAVPEKSALVEFAVYRPFNAKAPDNQSAYGESRYVAYIIRNQGDVRWTELGAANEIDTAVDALRQALRDPLRKDVRQLARSVDERVMQPVRVLTGDATQLLISPDGELNLIPFAALLDEQGRYLLESYSFVYLTSGRDLLRMQVPRESKNKPLVIADPLFGEPASGPPARTTFNGRRQSVTSGRDLSEVYFAPLGGTAQEARAIQTLFPEASVLSGAKATESGLKQVAAPRILHIATHGFFLGDTEIAGSSGSLPTTRGINARAKPTNPMLRSGLALTGANLRKSTGDSGILTALEASGLNLWGTKLVVLSACDTGIGEVRNGEGVYGLRRAFVLAGAESLVISLWPVSDYATRELMIRYYRNLKSGMGRGAALRQVQIDKLKRNPTLHPFYWANFIQSGEWANLDGQR